MKHEAEQKWGARLMRKSTIENALSDYNAALDDAARAFQVLHEDVSLVYQTETDMPCR